MARPFDTICAVLRSRLNGEPLDRRQIATLERCGIVDRRLVALASRHRITTAFAACLSDLGLDDRLPSDLRDYFAFMRASNAARNRALQDQLGELVLRLNGLGVEPCLLKGAARLVDGLYPDPSWRFMVDLDVLVPEDRLQECVDALRADGYYEEPAATAIDRGEGKHYPALISSERPAAVEFHMHLAPLRFRLISPTHDVIENSIRKHSSLGHIRLPQPEMQIIHLIAHRQIFHADRFYHAFILSDAIELSLLIKRWEERLNWSSILDKFIKIDWQRSCRSSLHAARIMVGAQVPRYIGYDLRTRLHLLRMLNQERFHSARAVGLLFGWFIQGLHRLSQPDRTGFFARVAADPNAYFRVLKDQFRW